MYFNTLKTAVDEKTYSFKSYGNILDAFCLYSFILTKQKLQLHLLIARISIYSNKSFLLLYIIQPKQLNTQKRAQNFLLRTCVLFLKDDIISGVIIYLLFKESFLRYFRNYHYPF